jgi:hypothetical protein
VVKADGEDCTTSDNVTVTNNLAASVINSCDVYLNNTLVSRSNNLFPYSVHLQNLVGTSGAYKSTVLAATQLFTEDNSSDAADVSNNDGFKERFHITSPSKMFEIAIRPGQSIFESNRYLPTNVGFRLVLRRSLSQFCLVGQDERSLKDDVCPYKLFIEQAVLSMKRHVVLPDIQHRHLALLNNGQRLNYPLKHSILKAFVIPPNTTSVLSQILFDSNIPSTVVMAFVTTKAFNGSIDTSPFILTPNGVEFVQIKTEGDLSVTQEITIDNSKNKLLQAYQTMYAGNPSTTLENGLSLRPKYPFWKYKLNFCIVFDLASSANPNTYSLPRRGSVKTEIRLKSNTESLTCIVMGRYDALLQIGKDYEVYSDLNLS